MHDEALSAFIQESRDLLERMEAALLAIEAAPRDQELLNAIFRAAHTIKGSAGIFSFQHIVDVTHHAESVLEAARRDQLRIDGPLASLLLAVGDHIRLLIDEIDAGRDSSAAMHAEGQALATRLQAVMQGLHGTPAEAIEGDDTPATADPASAEPHWRSELGDRLDQWRLAMRFGPDTLRDGFDPLSFVRYLETLATQFDVRVLTDGIPPLSVLEPDHCHLGFEVAMQTAHARAAIDETFEFVREDSQIHILPPQPQPQPQMAVQPAASMPASAAMVSPLAGQARAASPREGQSGEQHTLRVDARKLDQLINLVGEMIVAGAGTSLLARQHKIKDLMQATSALGRLMEEVRDSALNLRMVPIGGTFNRFQRLVRDLSQELGKDIALDISGADTELDKTVIEKLSDPLTHLVRNAMDHGIEPEAERVARGKPAQGTVRLHAHHEAGHVVVEVSDDGRGLSRARILAKAIERGLVAPEAQLSEHEVQQLIFQPGFSTADQVSNISGRGVGMDVVKRSITSLRGAIEIASTEGQGATIRIRLPLTLAIIDGFLMGVGKACYVVPLSAVVECIELGRQHPSDRDWIDLRGEVLPVIRLRQLYDIEGEPGRRQNIVVVQGGGKRVGLVVDQLMGELQTVIKPLGKVFQRVQGVSGFTILGNGSVALLMDIPGLLSQAGATHHERLASPAPALSG